MTDKEKLKTIKVLADAMYYATQNLCTDASRLHKAMEAYHQFVITEYHKEDPVSENLEQAAKKYADKHPTCGLAKHSFKAGAQWQKELFINKACAWLEENLHYYWSQGCTDPTEFINDFKKAMEE